MSVVKHWIDNAIPFKMVVCSNLQRLPLKQAFVFGLVNLQMRFSSCGV